MADRPVHHYHSAHDGGESLPRRSGERGNALSMAEQSAIDEYSQLLSNLNSVSFVFLCSFFFSSQTAQLLKDGCART